MADIILTIWEKHRSRSGKYSPANPSLDIIYAVLGEWDGVPDSTDDPPIADENDVNALVADTAPATISSGAIDLTRQGWQREHQGGGLWEVTVNYDRNEIRATGFVSLSCDITGGTQHITQSKETIGRAGLDEEPPDCKRTIGVTDNGIEGVDVVIPKMELTLTAIADPDILPPDYILQLRDAVGKTNDAPTTFVYRGQTFEFEEGELLFLSGPATPRPDGDWEFNFKFAVSKTAAPEELIIGGTLDQATGEVSGGIEVLEKRGHDYLWVRFEEVNDGDGHLVRRPTGAYVERVYDAIDFDELFNREWSA